MCLHCFAPHFCSLFIFTCLIALLPPFRSEEDIPNPSGSGIGAPSSLKGNRQQLRLLLLAEQLHAEVLQLQITLRLALEKQQPQLASLPHGMQAELLALQVPPYFPLFYYPFQHHPPPFPAPSLG